MRILAEIDLVLKEKHLLTMLLISGIVGVGSVALVAGSAAAADRYAPQPWGIDSPAGQCVVCHSL